MPGHRIRSFAIESEQAEYATVRPTVTIRSIGAGLALPGAEVLQHRALGIGGEQVGVEGPTVAPLFGQQLFVMLENNGLNRALNLVGQAGFAVKTLEIGLVDQ